MAFEHRALQGLILLSALLFAACGEEKAGEGETCLADQDCQERLECEGSKCIAPSSKQLYEACWVDEECDNAGTCAAGFCTRSCGQYVPTGTFTVGQCVVDGTLSVGVECLRGEVGCCMLTRVEYSSASQDEVSGQCTTVP